MRPVSMQCDYASSHKATHEKTLCMKRLSAFIELKSLVAIRTGIAHTTAIFRYIITAIALTRSHTFLAGTAIKLEYTGYLASMKYYELIVSLESVDLACNPRL